MGSLLKDRIILPTALQVCMDDFLWHNGADMRHIGQPSRTGMPRKHSPLDYDVVDAIGKAIDMKIMCPICLAEWDKDNILTHEIGTTYQPHTWDRASKIDMKYAEECFEKAENSKYIEYTLHGLMHGNYDAEGRQITELEYFEYKNPNSDIISCMPEEEILRRFELFFRIYDSWGFKKKIRSFAEPNEPPKYIKPVDVAPLASALKKQGISYWANYWMQTTEYFDSVLYMSKSKTVVPAWNAYDCDPSYLPDFLPDDERYVSTILGVHWPNFLRYNPENNMSVVPLWTDYFKRQSEIFGLMLSKDIAFAANQHLYKILSDMTFGENSVFIDVGNVFMQPSVVPNKDFYVSIKNGLVPKECRGGNIELYETHETFSNYKITHTLNRVEIVF